MIVIVVESLQDEYCKAAWASGNRPDEVHQVQSADASTRVVQIQLYCLNGGKRISNDCDQPILLPRKDDLKY